MKRPEKKKFNSQAKDQAQSDRDVKIYNQAIADYEKFLPNWEEIRIILVGYTAKGTLLNEAAKAISKRIGKQDE